MNSVTYDFRIGEHVTIPAIGVAAMVRAIRLDKDGLSYLLTYWWEGRLQEVWLTEPELEPRQ